MAKRILIFTVMCLSLGPASVATMAIFLESSVLTSGLDLSKPNSFSLENASKKIETTIGQDGMFSAFMRSVWVAMIVGVTTAWLAFLSAFLVVRIRLPFSSAVSGLGFLAYLTPPVLLMLSMSWLSQFARGDSFALMLLIVGQATFLFPINYVLALGHWRSTPYEIDRAAAIDGANLLMRLRLHLAGMSPSTAYFWGLCLLTFMLSWSDVLFSKYLLQSYRDSRLLADLVIERLQSFEEVTARGELAAVAALCFVVAGVASLFYSIAFIKAHGKK